MPVSEQFTHIPGPRITHQDLHRLAGNPLEVAIVLRREFPDEAAHQQRNVLRALVLGQTIPTG